MALARQVHARLDRASPPLAEAARCLIAPLIRAGNRAFERSGSDAPHRALADRFQAGGPPAPYAPLVSVIVPNFNHAPFLRQRLDCIYAQTWAHFEVILLDDASSDDSLTILAEYAARHPENTRLVVNTAPSGGAFRQWEKGLRLARGDLVWIAESDDWCDPDFLETLVPLLANPAVQLAYVPSVFMNARGEAPVWTMAEYLADLGPGRWRRTFVLTAPEALRAGFAERNIIPCASSALLRRPDPDRLEALEAAIWREMQFCGDWLFYLNQIRGGLIAYCPQTRNYYRQHGGNASANAAARVEYYAEHEAVARCVQRHYAVDPAGFTRLREALARAWARHRPDAPASGLDACFRLAAIIAEAAHRKPGLLMVAHGFCTGGGEIFPITLANAMKAQGYAVTYLNCRNAPDNPGIRGLLARDIPVVSDLNDLQAIARDLDIGVIHSHHAMADSAVLDLMPQGSTVRSVVTLHGMYEAMPPAQAAQRAARLARRCAAIVHVADKNLSDFSAADLAQVPLVRRIENAVAPSPATAPTLTRAALGLSPSAFVVALVSRAFAPKGWAEAITAVAQARRISGADVQLVLVGDGPEHDRLAGHVPPFVHLTGFLPRPAEVFALADIGLLPSRFAGESFPLVIIECLQAGTPVIATDLGAIRDMLTTPDGLAGEVLALDKGKVPTRLLARRIAALASQRGELAAMAARVPMAAQRFDHGAMARAYDEVYRQACAPGHGR